MKQFLIGLLTAAMIGCATVQETIYKTDATAQVTVQQFWAAVEVEWHNKAAWPNPAQHAAIAQKVVAVEKVIIYVEQADAALTPNGSLPSEAAAELATLPQLVTDLVNLANGAPTNVVTAVQNAQKASNKLAGVK